MRSRSLLHLDALGLATGALLFVTTTSIGRATERASDLDRLHHETVAALDGLTDTQTQQAKKHRVSRRRAIKRHERVGWKREVRA